MQTIFDWLTVATFIAIAATFFYRTQRERPTLAHYIALSIGCAIANTLGNLGYAAVALALIGALVGAVVWLSTRPYRVSK